MAIRVVHGEPSTYAQLGRLVGEARREERDIERAERRISEARQMKFRTETQQLQADLAEQNAQRQIAFQFERLNRAQEHDLEMLFQRNQIIQMNQLQKEIQAENERERKLKVIAEDDRLNEEQKTRARIQILTGVRLPAKQKSLYDQYMGGELGSLTGLTPGESEPFREPRKYTTPAEVGYGRWGYIPKAPVQTRPTASALTGELGTLNRPDGDVSTEISITVTDRRLNGGRPTNIPTLVKGQVDVNNLLVGKKVTREQEEIAINRATRRVAEGAELPSYDSISTAVKAAQTRSETKPTPEIPEPKTEAEIAKLPKGSVFRAPDGTLKYKQ